MDLTSRRSISFVVCLVLFLVAGCGGNSDHREPDVAADTPDPDVARDAILDGTEPDQESDELSDADLDDQSDPPQLVELELLRDDRVADAAALPVQGGLNPNSRIALKLTPPVSGTLKRIRVAISPFGNWQGEFLAQVYAGDGAGGLPGAPLLPEPIMVQLDTAPSDNAFHDARFVDVDLSEDALTVDGPFYVAMIWPGAVAADAPNLAIDVHTPPDGALIDFGDGVGWLGFTDVGIPMLRAVVEIPEDARPDQWEISPSSLDCSVHEQVSTAGGTVVSAMTPPFYPFSVQELRYDLHNYSNGVAGAACDATLAHRVSVFAGGDTPPENPTLIETFDMAVQADSSVEVVPVYAELSEPVTLTEGERLYVAIETPGDDPTLCVGVCRDSGSATDAAWEAAEAAPPWTWTGLSGGGALRTIAIGTGN